MRIGVPRSWARRTTCSTLSAPPMLPGLMRTAATPASIARSASEALKWMSAITGTCARSTSSGSASASGRPGTATRTRSTPASTRRSICAIVASTSCVLVVVIDCTVTGEPPPIGTPPTTILRSLAISCIGTRLPAGAHGAIGRAVRDAPDVVREPDREQHQHRHDADQRDALVDLAGERPLAEELDQREQDVPAVERQERQQVEDRERERDQREQTRVDAVVERRLRLLRRCRRGSRSGCGCRPRRCRRAP